MAAAEGEAERRADSEGRITDTRTEAGDPEVTDKEEVVAGAVVEEVVVEVATEDPAMAGAATLTGVARPEPRVEVAGTTEDLTTGGEGREVMSAVSIFYLVGSFNADIPPAWPEASEGQELVMCDFDRMFLP